MILHRQDFRTTPDTGDLPRDGDRFDGFGDVVLEPGICVIWACSNARTGERFCDEHELDTQECKHCAEMVVYPKYVCAECTRKARNARNAASMRRRYRERQKAA